MMWCVTWLPAAVGQLASLWINAPDKSLITRVADEVERMLENKPDQIGIPYRGRRVLFKAPLAVTFAVYPAQEVVEVLQVERISQ